METIELVILSVIQGVTELLPVSSSAHLILISKVWNTELSTLMLTILHLGTSLAIIVFLRKLLFTKILSNEKLSLYLKIIVSSIPAGITGILFENIIEEKLRATWIIAVSLIVWGIAMIVFEQKKNKTKDSKDISIENITWKQSIIMGIAQAFALIPGTSRSGITTIAGMFSGLDKYTAFEYSFILGIPVLLGASILEIGKTILNTDNLSIDTSLLSVTKMLPVILISFVVGYLALIVVRKYKKKNWLTVFGIYRIIVGILILIFI